MNDNKIGYMCKIDYDYELESALGGNTIYPSLKDLKKNHPFITCGIVKVRLEVVEVIEETDVWRESGEEEKET